LPKLLPEMHVIPDQDISFSFSETRLVNWGEESPTSGTEFNAVYIEKHTPAYLGLCSLQLRCHISGLVFQT